MTRIVFATRNLGKVVELRELLADLAIEVFAIDEIDREIDDVVEDGKTFADNAIKKAREVATSSGLPALADDSGLEVDALGGEPGVYSARYAGEDADDDANNQRLLRELADVAAAERTGRFIAVLAFADPSGPLGDGVITARGACEGVILDRPRGGGGFGYDPLFFVPELGQTFAELGIGSKNQCSHRARAMRAMRPRLVDYFQLAKPGSSR